MAKIKLEEVIDQLEFASDHHYSFFNRKTGEIYVIPEDMEIYYEYDLEADDYTPEWQKELILVIKDMKQNPDDYVQFPDRFYINEYSIMKRFCLSLKDEKLRKIMYRSIKGKGAFRRFKKNIYKYGIADDWYKFKDEALKELAIQWCKENDIEYY